MQSAERKFAFCTNLPRLFQESFGNLKHYRPFWCKQITRISASQIAALAFALVALANTANLNAALAQTIPAVAGPISIQDARQKGDEAVKREDYAAAVGWYRKAADQGDAPAQTMIGKIYLNGYGVARDYPAAMTWLRKAADLNYADAQIAVGLMFKKGLGVPKNDASAVIWWRKAAEQGNAPIQSTVGMMYMIGSGVPKDPAQAMIWFRKSAEQGYAEAQRSLGRMYRDGSSVPKDLAQSEAWYRKAAAQGDADAKAELAELQQKKGPGQRAKADKIPAALQYKCLFISESYKYPGAEGEKRYDDCLRSNWKKFIDGPFPLD